MSPVYTPEPAKFFGNSRITILLVPRGSMLARQILERALKI
jgi:hypothetical protein